jgi:predicted PurR-regulated permease PerM
MPLFQSAPPFYIKLAMVLVSAICLFYIAILGKEVLSPLLFGLLFSVLLLPLATFFEKRLRIHRSLASAISVLVLILSVGAIIFILASQASGMGNDWPEFKLHLLSSLKSLQQWISTRFHVNMTRQNAYVNNAASQLLTTSPWVVGATLRSLSSVFIFIVFVLIDTFFLLYYRRLLIKFLIAVFEEENSLAVYAIIAQVQRRISQYVQGLLLEMAIVSSVSCLALWILGIDYPILLGLLTGLLNLIPYIGIFISLLITILVAFATAGIAKILVVAVVLFVIHLVDANVLLPVIVAAKVRLNALISIIGVIIGGAAWGVVGAFLAIPVIAIFKIVFDRIESLEPWGMLLGDERDEKEPQPITTEIIKEQNRKQSMQGSKGQGANGESLRLP